VTLLTVSIIEITVSMKLLTVNVTVLTVSMTFLTVSFIDITVSIIDITVSTTLLTVSIIQITVSMTVLTVTVTDITVSVSSLSRLMDSRRMKTGHPLKCGVATAECGINQRPQINTDEPMFWKFQRPGARRNTKAEIPKAETRLISNKYGDCLTVHVAIPAQLARMQPISGPFLVKLQETHNPFPIGSFRPGRQMLEAGHFVQMLFEPGLGVGQQFIP
jgi:hypothetical protein